MTPAILSLYLLVLALAWANGANDVSKGIATLAGSGVNTTRRAVLWGSACTLAGGLAALVWGGALVETFSRGFVTPGFPLSGGFVGGTLLGAAAWVLFATWYGLPVSTTHALIGGIVGAALATAGVSGVHSAAIANKALLPLLISPLLALGLAWIILRAAKPLSRIVPTGRWPSAPANTGSILHWFSAGVTSFARALNDVPKIAAFMTLAIALLPRGAAADDASRWALPMVAVVMTVGGLWGGFRVLRVLAYRVVAIDSVNGLAANLSTSILVLAASPLGLPVSTTHVSTGSLFGIRMAEHARPPAGDALRLVLWGWIITLPTAAVIAALGTWAITSL